MAEAPAVAEEEVLAAGAVGVTKVRDIGSAESGWGTSGRVKDLASGECA